jgi:Ca2+-binding RTX toxin-like protein
MAIVKGTNGGETLNAADGVTSLADTIYGYGGIDTIFGLGGNDFIIGGAGGDTINGGDGFDTAFYTDSNEGVGINLSTSSPASGGTAEGDTFTSIENLYGSNFDDHLSGNDANNTLAGLGGYDQLFGHGGDDILSAGEGSSWLEGGAGADTMYGGTGGDTLVYRYSPEGVTVSLISHIASGGEAEGDTFSNVEHIIGSAFDDHLYGDNGENNNLNGGDGDDTMKGFGGFDYIAGQGDDDTLYGMNGDDYLDGGPGHDYLDGGGGIDGMIGGPGDDIYIVDEELDGVTEAASQGYDIVRTSVSYQLGDGDDVELLETTNANGTAAIELRGNSAGNHIIGNNGQNLLRGGGGFDTLEGRGGADYYLIEDGSTVIVESGGQGTDMVLTIVSYALTAGADIEYLLALPGIGPIDLTGNASGNTITGNEFANTIIGGGGNDYFEFDTAPSAANVDVLPDFTPADDTIWLENDIFTAFAAGAVAADRFVIGTAAQDANDSIIYDSGTGALFYDSDGVGGASAVQFAQLNPGTALTHLDFEIV